MFSDHLLNAVFEYGSHMSAHDPTNATVDSGIRNTLMAYYFPRVLFLTSLVLLSPSLQHIVQDSLFAFGSLLHVYLSTIL